MSDIELTWDVARRVLWAPEETLPLNVSRLQYVEVRLDDLVSLLRQWEADPLLQRAAMHLKMIVAESARDKHMESPV